MILDAEGAVPIPAGFQDCAARTQVQQGQEPAPFPESSYAIPRMNN